MNNKIALIAKGEKVHGGSLMNRGTGIDYRGPKENYEKAYTKDQLEYLFSHGLLEKYEPCGASWERPWMGEYWQFTDKGKELRIWYASTYWEYLYYHVFHLHKLYLVYLKYYETSLPPHDTFLHLLTTFILL